MSIIHKKLPKKRTKRQVLDLILRNYASADGYLYCIKTHFYGQDVVKIGKTTMKLSDEEDDVIIKLQRRYNTYYPDYDMLYFVRVIDVHNAEKQLLKKMDDMRVADRLEIFVYDAQRIESAFDKIQVSFPSLDVLVRGLSPYWLNVLNSEIRRLQKIEEEHQQGD
jgi:hypothetical protein